MTNAVSLAQQASTGVSQGFKNRIINGAMVIDQRNAGASQSIASGAATYTLDRYRVSNQTDGALTTQQVSTAPTGFNNSLIATITTADTSLASGQFLYIGQWVEGFNFADCGWGTANAKTVTLSFWVRSSLTGTFGGAFTNENVDRSYPFSYTISAANTWEQKSVTIAGDTTGTWLTTNGIGVRVFFGLGVASNLSGTAGSWSGNAYYSATGATSVVGTNGATFYITGVQLEVGSTATSFDYRPYGTELALCQRYYQTMTNGTSGKLVSGGGGFYSNAIASCPTPLKVTMRTTPTISSNSGTNYWIIYNNGVGTTFNAFDGIMGEVTADIAGVYASGFSRTAGHYGYFVTNNTASILAYQAEL